MKEKIFLITWHGCVGGVSKLVFDIAHSIKINSKFDVEVGYANDGGIYCLKLESEGIPTKIFKMKNGFDFIGALKVFFYIKKRDFSVVHLHYSTPLLRLMVFFASKRLVLTEHCGVGEYIKRKNWLMLHQVAKLLRNIKGKVNTTVSEYNKRDLLKYRFFADNEILVIPNGISTTIFSPANLDSGNINLNKLKPCLIVGTVRGLTIRHGVDHFILMASDLIKLRKDVRFVICGDGPERGNLESLVKKLNLQNFVYFTGIIPDQYLPGVISYFDVAVLPSQYEAFGISALEWMAMEKPVVAYAVGGVPEVISHQSTGILVYERNPSLLAAEVGRLLGDIHKAREIGSRARKVVQQNFDIEIIVKQYCLIYEQVLNN